MSNCGELFKCILLLLIAQQIVAPPASIKRNQNAEHDKHENVETNEVENMLTDDEFKVEYQRYLNEVISTLETDEGFKKKVQEATKEDYDSGVVADQLAMVSHHVRSKLDELKRKEVERLRQLVRELDARGKGNFLHPAQYEHIDHNNLDTFEVKDLDRLIKKVSKDIDEINRMRKEQFKEYEMEKHFEEEMKMKNMTETEKKEYQEHLEDMKKKHAKHDKIHHPGSKAQFEEVWEKQDNLESQEFDPKTFFYLHDVDGNGYWDINEVNALFLKELDKLYQAGYPEDDMRERQEEMERMREHVFTEMDKNHDSMISLQEYMDETKTKEFNQDEGWDTLEKQQIYTQQEYEEFERRRMQQIQEMMDRGYVYNPEHPNILLHPGDPSQHLQMAHMKRLNKTHFEYHHPGAAGYLPQGPHGMGYHPNGMPAQYHPDSQYGYQQMHPNQQQGYVPAGQMNQQGYHPNQAHPNQQGYHPNQMNHNPNQMNQHPNQMNQHPNQMNQHPNQMNQHPNQVNQHPNQMNQHPNQMNQHPSQVNQHPNQVNQHPNQMNQHPNQINQHPIQMNQHPNQVNQQQYQANSHPDLASQQPSAGVQSNDIHENINQGQMNQQPLPNHVNQPGSASHTGGNSQTNQVNNQPYQQQQQHGYQQQNQQGYQQHKEQQQPNQAAYQQTNTKQNQQYNQQAPN